MAHILQKLLGNWCLMVLKTKIITAIALVLLISIALSTGITLNLQSRRIFEGETRNMDVLSRIVHSGIQDAMSKGNAGDVQNIIENIGKNKEIVSLRILSDDGYILKSKDSSEVGKRSKEYAQFKSGQSRESEGRLTHFTPIKNMPQCYGCHSSTIKNLGIIELTFDISKSLTDINAIKKFLILSNIITLLMVAVLLSVLLTKLIIRPLSRFMSVIKEIEGGNWDAKIDLSGDDELHSIGSAFNNMLEEIKRLYDKNLRKEKEIARAKVEIDHKRKLEEINSHLEYKIKEVETANRAILSLSKEVKSKNLELEQMIDRLRKINEVGKVLTSIIETEELIKIIIRTTAEMLHAERGSIYLKRTDDERLTLRYKRGLGVEDATDLSLDFHPLYRELLSEGKAVFLSKNNRFLKEREIPTPAIGVPLKVKGSIIGGMLLEEKVDGSHFTADELELLGTMANQAMVAIENAWLYESIKANYFGTMQSLINALEANDRYTKGHSERVKLLSVELAKYIGLDYKEIEILEHAAILHDIGKIGIDSVVLNKAGRLSADEFSIIKAHPIIGDEILAPIGTLASVRQTILQHHERYDGLGYPYGIAGDEISLKARILSIVDTFDAMLTDRPYRKALPLDKVRQELIQSSGSQFDPFVVNSFLELIDSRPEFFSPLGYNFGG